MKKFEFTYVVKQVDLQSTDILVTYTPTNPNLTAYTFNISTCTPDDLGQVKPVTQSIIDAAPHHLWSAQELILEALPSLINSTETITPQ